MSREYLYDDYLQEQWDEKHSCKFTVDVAVNLRMTVEGYDTEEAEDLGDRVDDAISNLCEVLYHDKRTLYFTNMERDMDKTIDIMEIE